MKVNIKKLAVSAMLTAVAVSLSGFSIPIGASKCFPIQHLANVLAGVFLGPWYGVVWRSAHPLSEICWEQAVCWRFRAVWQAHF